MSLLKAENWKSENESWTISERKLVQSSDKGGAATRIYQLIESNNFVASYKMKLSRINSGVWGEGKFIFSDADSGEDFRIDFFYTANFCRLTIGDVFGRQFQVGSICELVSGKDYSIRISLKENFLSVHVDGMVVFENYKISKLSNKYIGFGTWDAIGEFDEIEVSPYREYECFIVMPFDEKRNFLYDYVIKPTLESHPKFLFKCRRADEPPTSGKISQEIIDLIKKSDIVIADVTIENPNVFYELGYTHSEKGNALLLSEKINGKKLDMPFDIHDFRCHEYIFSKSGFEEISKRISKVLETMIEEVRTK